MFLSWISPCAAASAWFAQKVVSRDLRNRSRAIGMSMLSTRSCYIMSTAALYEEVG